MRKSDGRIVCTIGDHAGDVEQQTSTCDASRGELVDAVSVGIAVRIDVFGSNPVVEDTFHPGFDRSGMNEGVPLRGTLGGKHDVIVVDDDAGELEIM